MPMAAPAAISAAFNLTPARGGRDAETLEAAKRRAPRAFSMRARAVTAEDFAEAACAAPGARIARAGVVALRRPYPPGHLIDGESAAGVDMQTEAPGALTVVVVPQREGDYPTPTAGELAAVAAHLDGLRLITTEVHVAPPQYLRLFDLQIVVQAAPGYSTAALRIAIGDELERRFHALTGGADGRGFPFGGSVHHADLVAAVFSVAGVARVEALGCHADGRSPDGADQDFDWRPERRQVVRLTNCPLPGVATDLAQITLYPDELPFIDTTSLAVSVVTSS
jgi:predicted phage baseplate assembly protein